MEEMNSSSQPLIKILRGKWRGLGTSGNGLGLILDFNFRDYLNLFPGSMLAVFIAIALHSDKEGLSFPSYDLLEKETGFARQTISDALKKLTKLEINGHRVLCKFREREEGKFVGSNRYIIFPSEEETILKDADYQTRPESSNHTMVEGVKPESIPQTVDKLDSKLNQSLRETTEINENHLIDPEKNGSIVDKSPEEIHRERTAAAIAGNLDNHIPGSPDASAFPEDVQPWAEVFSESFNVPIPKKTKGGVFAEWISELRFIQETCGSEGTDLVKFVAARFWSKAKEEGQPPFTVARPASINKSLISHKAFIQETSSTQPTTIPGLEALGPQPAINDKIAWDAWNQKRDEFIKTQREAWGMKSPVTA